MQQRKKSEMYPLVENWQTSGQTKKSFSKANGLALHTFHYWVKKYEKEKSLKSSVPLTSDFIPLKVASIPSNQLTLTYPNGVSLQLTGQMSNTYLASLIKLGSDV